MVSGLNIILALSMVIPLKTGNPLEVSDRGVKVDLPLTIISEMAMGDDFIYLATDAGLFVIPRNGGSPRYFGVFNGIFCLSKK